MQAAEVQELLEAIEVGHIKTSRRGGGRSYVGFCNPGFFVLRKDAALLLKANSHLPQVANLDRWADHSAFLKIIPAFHAFFRKDKFSNKRGWMLNACPLQNCLKERDLGFINTAATAPSGAAPLGVSPRRA